jgi:hypothetical protein
MSAAPNPVAAALDPRPVAPIGFGTPGTDDFVAFRRVFRDSGNNHQAPGWTANPVVVARQIFGGTTYRQHVSQAPDTLTLRVEVEDETRGEHLRALVGTFGSLVLPHNPYAASGTYEARHGTGYRTQTGIFLASAESEGLHPRTRCERLTLTFERERAFL